MAGLLCVGRLFHSAAALCLCCECGCCVALTPPVSELSLMLDDSYDRPVDFDLDLMSLVVNWMWT